MTQNTEPESVAAAPGAERVGDMMVAEVARRLVEAENPKELGRLAEVTALWESGRAPRPRSRRWQGGSIGSGLAPWVLSDVVYPLLTGTFAQVLGAATFAGLQRRRDRWLRPRRYRAAVAAVPSTQLALNRVEIAALRKACVDHGMALGLSRSKATLLADALIGVLVERLGRDAGTSR
ncbi:hypothetical protein [Umezawaea sp. NPDC059074]|uniref:hypothetical protein n=1 Tax=Umezawaea sp. NPDC059074 TaxID=3346716 RepID=UPI00368F9BD3